MTNPDFHADLLSRAALRQAHYQDESTLVQQALAQLSWTAEDHQAVQQDAEALVHKVRAQKTPVFAFDELLRTYDLSTEEGVALMCLAEAFLRIPDGMTAEALIEDKFCHIDWKALINRSSSWWVKASAWAGRLGQGILNAPIASDNQFMQLVGKMVARVGQPVIREAVAVAMRLLGNHFVMAPTMAEALAKAAVLERKGYRHSYDMLGEGARTLADADRYLAAYLQAINLVANGVTGDYEQRPTISVKLSAIHPRYIHTQKQRVMDEVYPRVLQLAKAAFAAGIGLTIDAEETDRLEISLDIIEALLQAPDLEGWLGLGLAVQSYQRRALAVIEWVIAAGQQYQRRLNIRLVKGAYWDSEIKRAQELGTHTYPVFTRKTTTDLIYLACAKRLLQAHTWIYPQFATHNAFTVAAILHMAREASGEYPAFEFQRLFGMGEALYTEIVEKSPHKIPCRIYAPIGGHRDLLAYLVRRLLENGANSSFVHKLSDPHTPVQTLLEDPIIKTQHLKDVAHPRIPQPPQLYGAERCNARGIDLADEDQLAHLMSQVQAVPLMHAQPIIKGERITGEEVTVYNPAEGHSSVGTVVNATAAHAAAAIDAAARAGTDWAPPAERAQILRRAADLMEQRWSTLIALCIREGGKTLMDAVNEVREALDFCRYYAAQVEQDFVNPQVLPGITGEQNHLLWRGRGVFVCISPWNFPLAIFLGQVVAALAAGNPVVAKPAEATPLIAAAAVDILYEAGIPVEVLHFLPGRSRDMAAALLTDPRVMGVAFTGSTATAQFINRMLAARDAPIASFIAETGGLNAMVVDSSSLPEQVVDDIVKSAFLTAGQRCSALRLLFVQNDIAEAILDMLVGATQELKLGNPMNLDTDIGPVISAQARQDLESHCETMGKVASLVYQGQNPHAQGWFIAPRIYELPESAVLKNEAFGPILHVVRYRASNLDQVVTAINASGYGLTLGIHSRIGSVGERIASHARVGNVYINRNMVGAVVGTQPFGGQGLSGTGFKAGGPNYLKRFATEQVVTRNMTASGGNITLLGLADTD